MFSLLVERCHISTEIIIIRRRTTIIITTIILKGQKWQSTNPCAEGSVQDEPRRKYSAVPSSI